ncbi:hypothetical protein AAMO2058_001217200 [Amorphochlora amoebiformis]
MKLSRAPLALRGGAPGLIQVIHRHGDRTPITPLRDETFWRGKIAETAVQPVGSPLKHDRAWGRLTTRGLEEMEGVGETLRQDLARIGLKPRVGGLKEGGAVVTRVRSTGYHRTVLSVQALLKGFLPDIKEEDVPDIEIDDLMDPFSPHHEAYELLDNLLSKDHVIEEEKKWESLRCRLTNALIERGILEENETFKPLAWPWLYEIYICLERYDGLPEEVQDPHIKLVEENLLRRWRVLYHDHTYREKVAGHMRRTVMESWERVMSNPVQDPPTEIEIYSAHDSTMFAIISELEHRYGIHLLRDNKVPPYASTLTLALSKGDDESWEVQASFSGACATETTVERFEP